MHLQPRTGFFLDAYSCYWDMIQNEKKIQMHSMERNARRRGEFTFSIHSEWITTKQSFMYKNSDERRIRKSELIELSEKILFPRNKENSHKTLREEELTYLIVHQCSWHFSWSPQFWNGASSLDTSLNFNSRMSVTFIPHSNTLRLPREKKAIPLWIKLQMGC